ncbi:MAG: DNA primase [Coriobacteriales bacterium]|jgi:DNA primase
MGRISDEDIARVRDATDIVSVVQEYVPLRQRGREFWGNCPFHGEKTPSFHVRPQTQTWHCFGCSQGGDVFKFLMLKEQFDFPESVRYLAGKAGITITEEEGGMPSGYRARLLACCEETAAFYHLQLMRGKSEGCASARSYLGSRGFGGDVPKKWNLGYAPGRGSLVAHLRSKGFTDKEMVDANVALRNDRGQVRDRFYERVMFPIRDLQGRTIAFGGRVIGKGEPKYINTSNCPLFSKRANMFGIDFAKSPIVNSGASIVVEGYTDVISMHRAGFENTVATLGTALTPQHVKLLTRFASKVIYLFDGDAAGQKAADRAAELITSSVAPESGNRQVTLHVAVIPNNMDPVEFIDAEGEQAMRDLLDNAQPLLKFVIDRRLASYDLSTPEQRAAALPRVLEPLVPIRESILADEYVNYLADIFKLDFQRMRRELDKAPVPRFVQYADDDRVPYGSMAAGRDGAPMQGGQGSGAAPVAPQVPAEPPFQIPREGVGRWEASLLFAYAVQPHVRMRIAEAMQGETWSNELYARVFGILSSFDTAARPADLVARCMGEIPRSEPLWGLSIPGIEDAGQAEQMVPVMLRERKKASLEDAISERERTVKYDPSLSPEQRNALFDEIVALQKELSALRK